MKPGPRPRPTRLKMITGNPGRRPLNQAEPQHEPLVPAAPAELTTGREEVDRAARAEWDRIAPKLIARGQVTLVDRGVLIAYCSKFGQWQALEQEAARHPFIVASPNGYPMPSPAISMANKALALTLKAAAELGITPSSRSSVTASDGVDRSPGNPLAQFLKRTPGC